MDTKKFYIENLGCFRNQVDAEYIIASMEEAGYQLADQPSEAGTLVVNTCGFIEKAKKESIDTFFQLRQDHPEAKVIVAGCLAQRYGDELLEMMPEADAIFGNRAPELLPQIMEKVEAGERVSFFPKELTTAPRRKRLLSHQSSAFIKIAEGCIHHCTFCAIPKIRGPLASRTVDSVYEEFLQLKDRGIVEFNLIAQDLASFRREHSQEGELVKLLEKLVAVPGDHWFRLFYIHPDTFPQGLLELMASEPRILPYFDLPYQHASEKVLKLMARYGSKSKYLEQLAWIREAIPDAVVRSTFLVGFPGETRRDFEELLDFQELAQLDWMGVFTYSREEQTVAYRRQSEEEFDRSVTEMNKRRVVLERRQQTITEKRLDRWVGRDMDLLVEEAIEGTDMFLARSFIQAPEVDGLVVVHADGARPGQKIRAHISGRNGIDLEARRRK